MEKNDLDSYLNLAELINQDELIEKVFIQHEFGLYGGNYGEYVLQLLYSLNKPVSITFHTVLPNPDETRKKVVRAIENAVDHIVVLTKKSSQILEDDYNISSENITVIGHGTHLMSWKDKKLKKLAGEMQGKMILSTFGLMSSNKSIETALMALPEIVKKFPNVMYLVLGKTHPDVINNDGEAYRTSLENLVDRLNLSDNVNFVNEYLELSELLDYLVMTDIYLFTSKDPLQAVSGTFAYAMGAGCPVVSTPIPHVEEVFEDNVGITFDFQNSNELANAVIKLLGNDDLREEMGRNAFHQNRSKVWENSAISHAQLFNGFINTDKSNKKPHQLTYDLPEIKLDHVQRLTYPQGMVQFAKFCVPDIESGFTLDDNARAMIAVCLHYAELKNESDLRLIRTYLNAIEHMQQEKGDFMNYVDAYGNFHEQNDYANLEDANGRAIWALGVILGYAELLPRDIVSKAELIMTKAVPEVIKMTSPRATAFVIKGLYFQFLNNGDEGTKNLIDTLAERLLDHYNGVADKDWRWFENYLTYANSTLPEAVLFAYLTTGKSTYKMIAHITFEFLLDKLFVNGQIKVISNRGWFQKGFIPENYGEQPIDISYTIQALEAFYYYFGDENYREKMEVAFSWFLGNNHLGQIIYDPVTGGCCDGLEKHSVNLNQGAESTVCYLIARMVMERRKRVEQSIIQFQKMHIIEPLRKRKTVIMKDEF